MRRNSSSTHPATDPRLFPVTLTGIVQNATDATFVTDKDHKIIGWSKGAEQLYGLRASDVLGKSPLETIIPRCRWGKAKTAMKTLNRGLPFSVFAALATKEGGERTVRISAKPIRNGSGDHVVFLTTVVDISELTKKEERLRRQNRQLRAFRDVASAICSPMGMKDVLQHSVRAIVRAVSADAGCIFLANGKGARFSPLVQEGNVEPIMSEMPSSSSVSGFTSHVIQTGKSVLIRDARQVKRKDWVSPETLREGFRSFISVPLMEKKGVLVFGTLEVASRRVNRFGRRELRFLRSASGQITGAIENAILREELREALAKKARLVKDTRHRLTNNLQAIASWLSTAVQSDHWAADGRAAVESAIRRISGMASIQQQMEVTELRTIDLADVMARLEVCVRAMHADQHETVFAVQDGCPKINSSLASPLAIAVNELIWNSCIHGFRSGQTGLISVKAAVKNATATIEVRDNGIGIPEDFDLDQNADIGLCIVKNIVERDLGGRLTLRRENGTVATITWPVTS